MSTHTTAPEATTKADAISVEKHIEQTEPTVATVTFNITSSLDAATTVRICDPLPEDWTRERVGFHPDHEPNKWEVDGNAVCFEGEIEGRSTHTTLYALKIDDEDDLNGFEEPPSVTIQEAGGSPYGPAPELESTPSYDPDAPVEPFDLPDPTEESASTDDHDNSAAPTPEEPPAVEPSSPVSELVTYLRTEATQDERKTLRRELSLQNGTSLSTQVEHLQQEYSELAAYTGLLRDFLDSEGSFTEAIDAVREDHQRLENRMNEHTERFEAFDQALERIDQETESVTNTVENNQTSVEELREQLQSHVESTDTYAEKIDALASSIDDHEQESTQRMDSVEREFDEHRTTVNAEFNHIRGNLEEMDEILSAYTEWIHTLKGSLDSLPDQRPSTDQSQSEETDQSSPEAQLR